MTFEEIEQLAKNREELPKRPQPEEWFCWKAMTDLYRRYRAREIDRDTAKAEKQEIIRHYQAAVQNHSEQRAAYAQYQEFIRLGGKYVYEIKNALESHADGSTLMRFALQLYGALTGDNTLTETYIKKMEDKSHEMPSENR